MTISFRIVDEHGINPYGEALREIERSILYPVSETRDQFSIVHGQRYDAFFTAMGKSRFIVALDDDRVCGIAAFTWKKVIVNGRTYTGLYLADMKLAKAYRGKKIMLRMIWFGFIKWLSSRRYGGWDFVFGAAMRDGTADVTRSFSGLHLGKLAQATGVLDIYFCPPETLANINDAAPAYPSGNTIALLSQIDDDIKDNNGLKEFRLASTGQAWPLFHLPFPVTCWEEGLGTYLKRCAEQLQQSPHYPDDAIACFALDRRLTAHKQWLADNGIQPGAVCTVYDWSVPFIGKSPVSSADYIHLSTSDI